MLGELLEEQCIQLHVNADSWEDALRKAAEPLVKNGSCTEAYVDGIISSTQKYGPYFVVSKHVALAHASPQCGVLETAMGLTVLENPVESGNAYNDPVKYIFTLCAKQSDGHLQALSELADCLDDAGFLPALDQAQSPESVLRLIRTHGKDKQNEEDL